MPGMDADAGGRHNLTDAQWEPLEPLLPELPTSGRPRTYGPRCLPVVGCSDLTRDTLVGCGWWCVSFRWYYGVGGLVVGH